MLEMVNRWYKRRFSDPHAVSLVAIILFGFITIYFFGHLIAPLLVAIVLAYLLEWPVTQLQRLGVPRTPSVMLVIMMFFSLMLLALFGLVPTIWEQVGNLINDIPSMYGGLQKFIGTIPERYPEDLQEAVRVLQRYTHDNPNDTNGWHLLSKVNTSLGNSDEELAARAEILALQANWNKAIQYYTQASQIAELGSLKQARYDARIDQLMIQRERFLSLQ